MHFRTRPDAMISIGMLCVAVGALTLRFLKPPLIGEDTANFISGIFYGGGIGLMLLGLWKRRRGGAA
jgi:hypothetical protein